MERKLVTLRTIDSVRKHPGADTLDLVQVGGWQMVSKMGTFKAGDRALYHEIDCFVPVDHPCYDFLLKDAIKWNGRVGARIKTIKLRKETSQGLLIPPSEFPELKGVKLVEDVDYAEKLGVVKWEAPVNVQGGISRGNFPSFIRKTEQERIQNIFGSFGNKADRITSRYTHPVTGEEIVTEKSYRYTRDTPYEVTVKLDGTSMTVYLRDGDFGVCSRNNDLADPEPRTRWQRFKRWFREAVLGHKPARSTYWEVAKELRLEERLRILGRNIAIQGELCGPSIQGNPDKLKKLTFFVFDIFDIDRHYYLPSAERLALLFNLNDKVSDDLILQHVPILEYREFDFPTIAEALAYARGPSLNPNVKLEGVVFKSCESPDFSFKIISNEYLLANGDR